LTAGDEVTLVAERGDMAEVKAFFQGKRTTAERTTAERTTAE
jgi:hypothetical protein